MKNLSRVFRKQKEKKNMKLSFITQFKIEFLLPFTSLQKCLEKHLTLLPMKNLSKFSEYDYICFQWLRNC